MLPLWWQAITWTNIALSSIRPLKIHFNDILIKFQRFSLQNAFEFPVCEKVVILTVLNVLTVKYVFIGSDVLV